MFYDWQFFLLQRIVTSRNLVQNVNFGSIFWKIFHLYRKMECIVRDCIVSKFQISCICDEKSIQKIACLGLRIVLKRNLLFENTCIQMQGTREPSLFNYIRYIEGKINATYFSFRHLFLAIHYPLSHFYFLSFFCIKPNYWIWCCPEDIHFIRLWWYLTSRFTCLAEKPSIINYKCRTYPQSSITYDKAKSYHLVNVQWIFRNNSRNKFVKVAQ